MCNLYIDKILIPLSDDIDYALNNKLDDLFNPTSIKNAFSKTIKVPITDEVDLLFAKYRSSEQLAVTGSNEEITGIYFDPNRKIPFELYDENILLFKGYVKFVKTSYTAKDKYYEITLNSTASDWYQVISTSEDKIQDILNHNIFWLNIPIDANMVFDSFIKGERWDYNQNKIKQFPYYDWWGYMGFTPTNVGMHDGFKSGHSVHGTKIEELTCGEVFESTTRQLRSYYQRPYVNVPTLVQAIVNYSKSLGFDLRLDKSFFCKDNPYYEHSVMLLDLLKLETAISETNVFGITIPNMQSPDRIVIPSNWTASQNITLTPKNLSTADIFIDNKVKIVPGKFNFVSTQNFKMQIRISTPAPAKGSLQMRKDYGYRVSLKTTAGNLVDSIYIVGSDSTLPASKLFTDISKSKIYTCEATSEYNSGFVKPSPADNASYPNDFNFQFDLPNYLKEDTKFKLDITVVTTDTSGKGVYSYNAFMPPLNCYIRFYTQPESNLLVECKPFTRSKKQIGWADLLGTDFNLSEWFVNYCKIFGLKFITVGGVITVTNRNTLYNGSEYIDPVKDKKLDKSVWEIKPCRFDNAIVTFDYKDTKITAGAEYKSQYDINYGGKKINTQYQFNNTTKKLFDYFTPLICSNEFQVDIANWWNNWKPQPKITSKNPLTLPSFIIKETDKWKTEKVSRALAFKNPKNQFTPLDKPYTITDDSDTEILKNEYAWHCSEDMPNANNRMVGSFPQITPFLDYDGKIYSWYFNKPSISFVSDPTQLNNAHYIYDLFWADLIADRYGDNGKILTTNYLLTTGEYYNIDWGRRYWIDGSQWLMNSIMDFNPNKLDSTKIEFIKCNDITNYQHSLTFPFIESQHGTYTYTEHQQQDYIQINSNVGELNPAMIEAPEWMNILSYNHALKRIFFDLDENFRNIQRTGNLSYIGQHIARIEQDASKYFLKLKDSYINIGPLGSKLVRYTTNLDDGIVIVPNEYFSIIKVGSGKIAPIPGGKTKTKKPPIKPNGVDGRRLTCFKITNTKIQPNLHTLTFQLKKNDILISTHTLEVSTY